MKSERRHELATNELADWIVHFPQWYKENQTTIIIGAIVAIGLVVYTIFFYSRENRIWDQKQAQTTAILGQIDQQKGAVLQGKQQGLGTSDLFLSTASALQTAAAETENPLLSALALIKRAEALRTELHYRAKIAEPDVQKYQLQQAMDCYKQAFEKAKSDPTIASMAEYGQALCLEGMRDFKGARELYAKIANAPEYNGTIYQIRAKFRLETLVDDESKVEFVSRPVAEPNQAAAGQSLMPQAPAMSDMNITPDLKLNVDSNKPK